MLRTTKRDPAPKVHVKNCRCTQKRADSRCADVSYLVGLQLRDLKARLLTARKHLTLDCVNLCMGDGTCRCSEGRAYRATNLKNPNWRSK